MSFSLDTSNFPVLSNYGDALRHWEKQKPWRSKSKYVRPLEKRSKTHCTIELHGNGRIDCSLHGTVLVTFHQDGRVDVYVAYASISTENFINAVLRRAPYSFIVNRGQPTAWKRDDQGYYYGKGQPIDGKHAQFDEHWQLLNPGPIRIPYLDVKKANAVRKAYAYPDFLAWRNAYETMHPPTQEYRWRPATWRPNMMPAEEVLAKLKAGPSEWVDLSQKIDNDYLLRCIYRQHPEIVAVKSLNYYSSISEWQNAYNLDRKYGWAV